jgi:hypothetical protein
MEDDIFEKLCTFSAVSWLPSDDFRSNSNVVLMHVRYSALNYYHIATNCMTYVSFVMQVCICIPFLSTILRLYDVLIKASYYVTLGLFFKVYWILLLLILRLT